MNIIFALRIAIIVQEREMKLRGKMFGLEKSKSENEMKSQD